MPTFGERLKDAMLIAAKTKSMVAKHCRVSRQTVLKWLKMKTAELSGAHLDCLCAFLRCRMRWLATGVGPMEPVGSDDAVAEMVEITKRLQQSQRAVWFAVGKMLVGRAQL